jgi:hypothetical protein
VDSGIGEHAAGARYRPSGVASDAGAVSLEAALFQEVLAATNGLKGKHAELYSRDPKRFGMIVRRATATALRRKPGPQPDPRIIQAAEEQADGAKWADLYPKYITGYERLKELNPGTCDDAEAGFRRKVYDYQQRNPRLKARRKTARKGHSNPNRKNHRRYKSQLPAPDQHASLPSGPRTKT